MVNYELIVIGGSMGGLEASIDLLKDLPANYKIPIVLVLHRLKGGINGLSSIFNKELSLKSKEVDEKELLTSGTLYIAPSNYHTLIEKNKTFSLDVSEPVKYSRPSIDVTFESAAEVFGEKTIAIILTGSNDDGTAGLLAISKKGGFPIVQDPEEAKASKMPASALAKVSTAKKLKLKEISILLQTI